MDRRDLTSSSAVLLPVLRCKRYSITSTLQYTRRMDQEGALRRRIAERNWLSAAGRQGIERQRKLVARLEHVRGKFAYALLETR